MQDLSHSSQSSSKRQYELSKALNINSSLSMNFSSFILTFFIKDLIGSPFFLLFVSIEWKPYIQLPLQFPE